MTQVLQILVLVVIIGVIYSLWRTTQVYGGSIGSGLKWVGVGILFFSLEALDMIFGTIADVSFVDSVSFVQPVLLHLLLMLLGLAFSGIGFTKLRRAIK